jgi:hypothetical protein
MQGRRPGLSPEGHHSCGTAPESHRFRCVCTGRGICARRGQPTALVGRLATVLSHRRRSERQLGVGQPWIGDGVGVKQVAELAYTVGDPRRGPGEVGVAVDDDGSHRQAQITASLQRPV